MGALSATCRVAPEASGRSGELILVLRLHRLVSGYVHVPRRLPGQVMAHLLHRSVRLFPGNSVWRLLRYQRVEVAHARLVPLTERNLPRSESEKSFMAHPMGCRPCGACDMFSSLSGQAGSGHRTYWE